MTGRRPVRVRPTRCSLCQAWMLQLDPVPGKLSGTFACIICDAMLAWPRMAA